MASCFAGGRPVVDHQIHSGCFGFVGRDRFIRGVGEGLETKYASYIIQDGLHGRSMNDIQSPITSGSAFALTNALLHCTPVLPSKVDYKGLLPTCPCTMRQPSGQPHCLSFSTFWLLVICHPPIHRYLCPPPGLLVAHSKPYARRNCL